MITHNSSLLLVAAVAIAAFSVPRIDAQIGNDNPTGPTGTFNGNITTGCSYDPYTGNARRSVTDIVVAGSVGAYPLAFSRVSNSREGDISTNFQFGEAGWWRHSYSWHIDESIGFGQPTQYNVAFPDGRFLIFTPSGSDSCFRASSGIRERFIPLDFNTMLAYLLLPDGGKVEFTASPFYAPYQGYRYQATAIIDPYGQRTSLTYNGDGSLNTIQEPGGRWLQLVYAPAPVYQWVGFPITVIDHVQASDGRVVQYTYGGAQFVPGAPAYNYLASVIYPADPGSPPPTAYYTYQGPNVPDYEGYYHGVPLLASCDDPMYEGPVKKISYTYGTRNSYYGFVGYGQILSENSGTTGQAVSTLGVDVNISDTRTETRGDGPSRTFNYSGAKLVNYTDFKGQTSYITYDGNGFTSAFTDPRGNTTTFLREGIIGAMSVLTHPDQSIQGYAYWYSAGGPYYVQIRGDERGHNTYFTRDGNFRLTRIDYPDYPNGAFEEFTYNGFGQVLTHKLTNGGTESFTYDGRGLMTSSTDPVGNVTHYYYYQSGPNMDRLYEVEDPRENWTEYEYNLRGQVTHIQHQDYSYIQNAYNVDGTLAWSRDELGHTTTYAYDDYKRLVSVTNPMNQTTSYNYAQDWANPYLHTTTNAKGVFSPMGKQIHYAYDENWERTIMRVPPTSDPHSDSNDAWTFYGYDAAGNLTWTQDPRGYATTFGYDNRNRRTSMTDALNQTTSWQYDAMNNLTRETRPDQSYRRTEYDSMNRVLQTFGFMGEGTGYGRDLGGNVTRLTDAKGASYFFAYDLMNRKTSATYPSDAYGASRTEWFWYDAVGNMIQHQNPTGQTQIRWFDNRNRNTRSFWFYNAGPDVVTTYDAASRVTSIVTADTNIAFGYDDANRKIWEDQTLSGYPTRRVNTPPDADGNRMSLDVANYYHIDYGYNQRNQLSAIGGFANFHYDANSNMTNREGVWGYTNETNFAYDELNRVTQTELGANGWIYARSHHQYDNLNRAVAAWRDEQSSKGERYGYDPTNQLRNVWYNADQVWTGNPLNASRYVYYDADVLNRYGVNDNGTTTNYVPDSLNQYTNIGGVGLGYDGNFNLTGYGTQATVFNAANQLTSLQNPGSGHSASFTYDGLGRCVRRTIDGVPRLFTYDGWKPMLEWDQWGNFLAWNVYGAGPDEILARGDSTYGALIYKQDRHGNVVGLLDGGGNVIEKYTYDAFGRPTVTDYWGNVRGNTSWYGNRYMFQGREWLAELGIYDFRNRYYHPALGRFLQKDPLGFDAGDMNLFRYCGGDPVNGSDPTGLDGGNDRAHDYDWNDRDVWGKTDYSFDVRYGVMDDFLGWEAASYMRDVFARNDAASQRFAEYSTALYDRYGNGTFATSIDAAIASIEKTNPKSIRENREYAWRVFRNSDGTYSYTRPRRGGIASSFPGEIPLGTDPAGFVHTHGGNDPLYDNEHFSPPDIDIVNERIYGIPGYLGTPSGSVQMLYPGGTPIILIPGHY